MEVISDHPWARVSRDGELWLKNCRPVQAYEMPLTVAPAARWPDRVPAVVEHGDGRLLLRDAGSPVAAFGDSLDAWLSALPLDAELQQGETEHVREHLAAGVPDQRVETLPAAFDEYERFRSFAPRFRELCARLEQPPTVQHDDLHSSNVYARGGRIVFLDCGDTVISHPFASLLIAVRSYTDIGPALRDSYGDPKSYAARDANIEWFLENIVSS